MSGVTIGFRLEPLMVPLASILPSHMTPKKLVGSRKYQQIRTSIEAIGLIEPLSITPVIKGSNQHLLLDGHIRLVVLLDIGQTEAACLVATDDEGYTYNNRINRLSTIQEHLMIRRAVARGVSPERLAKVLDVDVRTIDKKLSLLDGICPEASDLLKDRQFPGDVFRILRKMKSIRQVECVELMISANNVAVSYVEAMLVATPAHLLVEGKVRKLGGVSPDHMARMEREMSNLQGQYKLAEQTYGSDILNLVLARGYLGRLVGNEAVARYLGQRYPEVMGEFEAILRAASLEA